MTQPARRPVPPSGPFPLYENHTRTPRRRPRRSSSPVLPPALSEFKGHKLVVLNPHERFPLQFGLGKARLIVANIAAIQAFVASGGLSVA